MSFATRLFAACLALSGFGAVAITELRAEKPAKIHADRSLSAGRPSRFFNGLIGAVAKAWRELEAGADPLNAVIAGVSLVEDDPHDLTVGYGG